jgi:hypothetical protein
VERRGCNQASIAARRRRLACQTLCMLALAAAPPATWGSESPDEAARKLVLEAYRAAKENLRSGVAKGVFQYLEGTAGMGNECTRSASISVVFDQSRYFIDMQFDKDDAASLRAQKVLFDGKSLIVSSFSPAFRPNDCMGQILEVTRDYVTPPRYMFPFDPRRLADAILNLPNVEKLGPTTYRTRELPNGAKEVVISCRQGKVRLDFICPAKLSYHPDSCRIFNDGDPNPAQEFVAEWGQANEVWIVKGLVETNRFSQGGSNANLVHFDTFEVNPRKLPDVFKFSSLGIPENSGIRDDRPGEKSRWYINKPLTDTEPKDVEETLKAISRVRQSKRTAWNGAPEYFYTAMVYGGGALSLVGFVALIRGRIIKNR